MNPPAPPLPEKTIKVEATIWLSPDQARALFQAAVFPHKATNGRTATSAEICGLVRRNVQVRNLISPKAITSLRVASPRLTRA